MTENSRFAALLTAERKAEALLEAIESQHLVRPGRTETEVDQDIYALAEPVIRRDEALAQADRSIRAEHGAHLRGESAGTPNCRWRHGFLDLGPVFDEWEADVGRTYVMGDDPVKRRLCQDLPRIFDALKQYFDDHRDVTGAELYAYAEHRAEAAGWLCGGAIAGHIVGEFPHLVLL